MDRANFLTTVPDGRRRHLSYANVVATLALVVALGGTSYAAIRIGSGQIVDNSVRSKDIRNNSLGGQDIRNGTLTGRDIETGSLGGREINEARLAPVRDSLRLQGRLLSQLIVTCPDPNQATGAVCIETKPRPAADFYVATNRCTQVRGRLPLYVDLVGAGFSMPSAEWTADIIAESGGTATTLVYGNAGLGAALTTSAPRPYRCVFPLSN